MNVGSFDEKSGDAFGTNYAGDIAVIYLCQYVGTDQFSMWENIFYFLSLLLEILFEHTEWFLSAGKNREPTCGFISFAHVELNGVFSCVRSAGEMSWWILS